MGADHDGLVGERRIRARKDADDVRRAALVGRQIHAEAQAVAGLEGPRRLGRERPGDEPDPGGRGPERGQRVGDQEQRRGAVLARGDELVEP